MRILEGLKEPAFYSAGVSTRRKLPAPVKTHSASVLTVLAAMLFKLMTVQYSYLTQGFDYKFFCPGGSKISLMLSWPVPLSNGFG